jgi:RND family efflux transporter MFP subunit
MKHLVSWSLITALGLTLAACGKQEGTKPPAAAAAAATASEPARLVKTMRLTESGPKNTLQSAGLPAEIKPRIEARQGFRVAGKLTSRHVEVGQKVAAGAVLAKLDASDYVLASAAQEAQLLAARTEQQLASTELKRVHNLFLQNFVSQAQLDRQQAATDAAQARVRAAEQSLGLAKNNSSYTTLTAEVAGVVTAIEAEVGQVLAAGQTVVRIAKAGEIEAWVAVPETAVATFKSQPSFEVEVPSQGQKYQATLRELSPMADPITRTLTAKLRMPSNVGLTLGSTAYVREYVRDQARDLPTTSTGLRLLPLAAVTSKSEQPQVWVVSGNVVKATKVTLGAVRGEWVEITQGLSGNETVVSAGAAFLRDGQTVRIYQDPNEVKATEAKPS